MRIVALSDLHLDYVRVKNGLSLQEIISFLENIKFKVSSFNPDIFIFAGDISRRKNEIDLFLKSFKNTPYIKIFVPGNHDVWIEDGEDSLLKYKYSLKTICEENEFYYLPLNPLIINNIGFVGSLGWYDYSLGSEEFSIDEYEKGKFADLKWREIYWKLAIFKDNRGNTLSNIEVCKLMIKDLEEQIEGIKNKVEKIITVIHTLPFEDLVYKKNFFSAYLGSKFLGEVLLKEKKIRFLICGHEHNPLVYNKCGIKIYRCPFGYLKNIKDWEYNFLKGVKIIELDNYRG